MADGRDWLIARIEATPTFGYRQAQTKRWLLNAFLNNPEAQTIEEALGYYNEEPCDWRYSFSSRLLYKGLDLRCGDPRYIFKQICACEGEEFVVWIHPERAPKFEG